MFSTSFLKVLAKRKYFSDKTMKPNFLKIYSKISILYERKSLVKEIDSILFINKSHITKKKKKKSLRKRRSESDKIILKLLSVY